MIKFLLSMLIVSAAMAQSVVPDVLPPSALSPEVERARIQAERDAADSRFAQGEALCYQKFAVNDCLIQARVVRREVVADLRRQEAALNAQEAKRKGAEQLSRIEERSSPQALQDEAARIAAAEEAQRERQRVFDEKTQTQAKVDAAAATRVQEAAEGAQRRSQAQSERAGKQAAASEEQKKYDEKQQEARDRKARQQKDLAAQKKSAVKPLPVAP